MFNRKLVNVISYIIGVLLVLKMLLFLVMYIWSLFGTAPIAVINPGLTQEVRVILLLQEIGMTLFAYGILAVIKSVAGSNCCCEMEEAASPVRKEMPKKKK